MTLVVLSGLSGLLGAAILAIALLTYWLRKTRADINRLQAELIATKITAQTPLSLAPSLAEQPEPVRRKRHLALYIGGAVAAFFASAGDRLRSFVRGRRAILAVAATSILVAVSAAAYYAHTGRAATPPLAEPGASMTFPGTGDSDTHAPESSPPAEHQTNTEPGTAAPKDDGIRSGAPLTLTGRAGVTDDDHRVDGSGQGGQGRPGTGAPGEPPAPAPPDKTKPPTPAPTPDPTPTPPKPTPPSEPPPTTPPPSDGREICILPGVLGVCTSLAGALP